jgi:lipid-binding SYLF domain-containing protein
MTKLIRAVTTAFILCMAACATAPKTEADRQSLAIKASGALSQMVARDPGLRGLIDRSAGYAIFPSIGKGAYGVGGAWGRGVVYEHGVVVGYTTLTQASFGLQAGGQSYAQLIVFSDPYSLGRLKRGNYELNGSVSAVAVTAGASGVARFSDGVAVFQMVNGGLMVEAAVAGQKLDYQGT